jgi:hypothetical protein
MMITDRIENTGPTPLREQQVAANGADIGSGVTDLEEQARAFIKKRPVVAVLSAVGLGYLVARLVSRARG